MVRAIALIGMTGGFLAISPDLRDTVVDTISAAAIGIEDHGPYSYIGLGFVMFVALLYYFSRGHAQRN
jgi:hypothetical protein